MSSDDEQDSEAYFRELAVNMERFKRYVQVRYKLGCMDVNVCVYVTYILLVNMDMDMAMDKSM